MAITLLAYTIFVAHAFTLASKVQAQRFDYMEEQIEAGATSVVLPDSVSFADWQNLERINRFYYRETREDTPIIVVDYETWLLLTGKK